MKINDSLPIGICDQNGKEIKINDVLRCKFGLGDDLSCDALFSVECDYVFGLALKFIKLSHEENNNQRWTELSMRFGGLRCDYSQEFNKPMLCIAETHGENHISRFSWIKTQFSQDVTIVEEEKS